MESIKEKRFVLIDGNAILHRAFHALPPLTDKNGQIVNAVYGFFSMFLKIIEDLNPSCIVVCFDRPKPTFRKTLYVGYQAKRPKMDGDLVPQIGIVHKLLEKAGVQIFEIDGYEADDVIGTIANQVQSSKFKVQSSETIIVSGDRDMLQLVNSHVKVLAPIVGITNMIMFDEEKVKEKYGLNPSQIIDYKALVGDASDNYPGVAGVGPKTAKDLLQKFGSLEKIYESLNQSTARQTHVSRPVRINESLRSSCQFENSSDASAPASRISAGLGVRSPSATLVKNLSHAKPPRDSEKSFSTFGSFASGETSSLSAIPPKIAEKLAKDAEQAALAKKLATILTDAPVTLDINKCSMKKINKENLVGEFEKLGFKSLMKRLGPQETEGSLQKHRDKNEQLGLL